LRLITKYCEEKHGLNLKLRLNEHDRFNFLIVLVELLKQVYGAFLFVYQGKRMKLLLVLSCLLLLSGCGLSEADEVIVLPDDKLKRSDSMEG